MNFCKSSWKSKNRNKFSSFFLYFWPISPLQNIRSKNHGTSKTSALTRHWNPLCQFLQEIPVSFWASVRSSWSKNYDVISSIFAQFWWVINFLSTDSGINTKIIQELKFFLIYEIYQQNNKFFKTCVIVLLRERLPRTAKRKDRQK